MALQVPTSPNVCFYTTWRKQNKRNMHWNEQQTSRNWRLDRPKFSSQRSELMKYIVYLLIAVLPAIKRVTGDTFVFHQYRARQRIGSRSAIELLGCETSDFISPDLWSPTALISIRSITSSGGHAIAGLSDYVQECGWTQEAPVEIWIGLERNIIDTAINKWRKRLRACVHLTRRANI